MTSSPFRRFAHLAGVFLVYTFTAAPCYADDDFQSMRLSEEASRRYEQPSPTPETSDPAPRKAENIDLKEVVTQPLLPDLQAEITPPPEPQKQPPVADTETAATGTPTASPAATTRTDSIAEQPVPDAQQLNQKTLVLLQSEVPPGTATRLAWTPDLSFMGIATPSAVLVVNGTAPGPTVCLTAAVHGDELNGIEIVRHILYDVKPEELAGAIIGVPIVNIQGFRRASRYLPDRRDLNRYFPGHPTGSSASRIAHSFFTEVISHCDMLVDLHTGSFRRTNMPQLRADLTYPDVEHMSRQMGSIVVLHSKGEKGSLRRETVEVGIPAVTLEAGEPHELQKNVVDFGVKSVETLLDSLGMVKRRAFWELKSEPVYYKSRWIRATSGGILFSQVALGDRIHKGQVLGTVTDPITNARSEIVAPSDGRVIGMALNQVMYPGFAAYHIGLQASVAEAVQEKPEDNGDTGEPPPGDEEEEHTAPVTDSAPGQEPAPADPIEDSE